MARFIQCISCGNVDKSGIYICDECNKICCDVCGGPYVSSWNVFEMIVEDITGQYRHRRCPHCGGVAVLIGSIDSGGSGRQR
jgi:hypothetical protein